MASSVLLVVTLTATSVVVVALAVAQVKRGAAEGSPARADAKKRLRWRARGAATDARRASSAGDEQPAPLVEQQPRQAADEQLALPAAAEPMPSGDAMTVHDTAGDDADESEIVELPEPALLDLPTERNAAMMKNSRPSKPEHLEDHDHAYAHVGQKVSAILTTAEGAAAEIRAAATREAEETKSTAEQYAAAIRSEADVRRSEATSYSDTRRAEADAYADDVSRRADETSARTLAEAEERARLIVSDARRKAAELEVDGRRRGEELARISDGAEERVASLLAAFKTVTGELETLLPEKRRQPDTANAAGHTSDEPLDEAVRRVALPGG